MGKTVCPKCEKDDQVQKVTSIVTSGSATAYHKVDGFAGGSGTSVSQTQLAKRLAPPSKPISNGINGVPPVMAMLILVGGGLLIAFVLFSLPANDNLGYVGIALFLGIVIWISSKPDNKLKSQLLVWEQKLSNWKELYYCHRDDCVFDPNTNKTASPENLERLL
jgi:hypothetical protein